MAEIPDALLTRMVAAYEENTTSIEGILTLARDNHDRAKQIELAMLRQLALMERAHEMMERFQADTRIGRDKAVDEINEHTSQALTAVLEASDRKQRTQLWIVAGIFAVSQLLGVGLQRVLAILKG